VAFPLLMGQSRTPACLVDGTAYQLGKNSGQQTPRWQALERSTHAEIEQLQEQVAASITAGNPNAAHVALLDRWSEAQAQKLAAALRQPE